MAPRKKTSTLPPLTSASQTERLAAALSAWNRHDHDGACRELLEAWRAIRAPALAEALDVVSAQVSRVRGGIDCPPKQRMAKWTELFAAGRPGDLGTLLSGLTDGTSKEVAQKIELLAERAPDPRISKRIVELLEKPPFTATSTGPLFTRALAALEANADPRAPSRLSSIQFGGAYGAIGTRLAERVPAVSAGLDRLLTGAWRTLTSEEESALQGLLSQVQATGPLAAPKSAKTKQELLEAVWANPDADEPRHVLADHLLEQGDVHGEFIALQLQHKGRAPSRQEATKESALIKANWRHFLGPLDGFVQRDGLEFERGFVVKGRIAVSKANTLDDAMRQHPAWATLRDVTYPRSLAMMRRATTIRELLLVEWLRELLGGPEPFPVVHLQQTFECQNGALTFEVQQLLRNCRKLPHLRSLTARFKPAYGDPVEPSFRTLEPLWSSPLGPQLVEFSTIIRSETAAASWMNGFAAMAGTLSMQEVTLLEDEDGGIAMCYAPSTKDLSITLPVRGHQRPQVRTPAANQWAAQPDEAWLAPILSAIQSGTVAAVTIFEEDGTPSQRPEIVSLTARFGPR